MALETLCQTTPMGPKCKSLVLNICSVGRDKTDLHTQYHQQMWAVSSSLQIQGSPTLNTDSMDMNVSKFQETAKDRGAQWLQSMGVAESDMIEHSHTQCSK